jgi:hypothetical protein
VLRRSGGARLRQGHWSSHGWGSFRFVGGKASFEACGHLGSTVADWPDVVGCAERSGHGHRHIVGVLQYASTKITPTRH